MKTRRLLAATMVAALIPAGAAEAKAMKGTVVHRNHRAHSFVVAGKGGSLSAVHSNRSPRVGRKVAFAGKHLANGTFSARHFRDHGRAHDAVLRGMVTFVDSAARTFTVSDNGASILVHVADTTIALPAVGDTVLVKADLDTSTPTTVEATRVFVVPAAAANAVEIEGTVLAIDTTTRTLMISADDDNSSGQAISVVLPSTFDISAFHVGDEIEIDATLNPDGTTYTAVGTTGDDNVNEAEHHGDDQGDLGDDDGHDGDNSSGPGHANEDNSGPGNAQDDNNNAQGDDDSGDNGQGGDGGDN